MKIKNKQFSLFVKKIPKFAENWSKFVKKSNNIKLLIILSIKLQMGLQLNDNLSELKK